MKTHAHLKSALLATLLAAAAPPILVVAQTPNLPLQRLVPPTTPTTNQELGASVAVSDQYIVSGSPKENYAAPGKPAVATAGAVHIFRANGTFFKRIYSPTPQLNAGFGSSVAADATTLYVSAPLENTTIVGGGAVYAFNIATGAMLWKYTNPTLPGAGTCLAVSGRNLVVGYPTASSINGMVQNSGQVVLLNAFTGAFAGAFEQPVPEASAFFGERVAVEGSLLVASTTLADSGMKLDSGWAGVFDLETHTFLTELVDPQIAVAGHFGGALAIHGNTIAISRIADPAKVLLYDAHTRLLIRTVAHPDGKSIGFAVAFCGDTLVASGIYQGASVSLFDRHTGALTGVIDHLEGPALYSFGNALATNLNSIVVGAPSWADKGVTHGAVFVTRTVRSTLPGLTVQARIGDSAPAAGGATYASIIDQTFTNSGFPTWKGLLNGSPANRRKAVWNRLSAVTDLPIRQGDNLGVGGVVGDVVDTLNASIDSLIHVRTTGSARNALWSDNGSMLTRLFQEGEVFAAGGLVANKLLTVSASNGPAVQVLARTGVAGVKSTDDAMVARWDSGTSLMKVLAREGSPSPVASRNFGQFAPRISQTTTGVCLVNTLQGGTAADNQLLFYSDETGTMTKIAQRGDPAPGCGGAFYGQFLGEQNTPSQDTCLVFRATLTGCPATENEALFSPHKGMGLDLVARKGGEAPGLGGKAGACTFTRFSRVFPGTVGLHDVFFQATIKGIGVTAANDEAFWLYEGALGSNEVLMREGDIAPGCGGARVGAFQRVEVDSLGRYYILVSLTGAAVGADQALFVGGCYYYPQADRKPHLALRKGMQVSRLGSQQIKSINFSPRPVNAQGFGAGDVSLQVGISGLLFTLTYTDNTTELVSGWPDNSAP